MTPEAYTASLALVLRSPQAGSFKEIRSWLRGVARRVHVGVPAFFTVEMGRILTRRGQTTHALAREPSHELRQKWVAFSEHVLGRISSSRALFEIIDQVAEAQDTDAAIVTVIARIADRLTSSLRPPTGLGEIRRLIEKPDTEIYALIDTYWAQESIQAELASILETWVLAARRQPALIQASDAFILRHLSALKTPSAQLAFAQLADAKSAFDRTLPRHIRVRRKPQGTTPTAVASENVYPVGGYHSIAQHGPLENMVSSELMYLEPEEELDLFDLRYVTGELLKYTRDEGVWHRAHRQIDIVVSSQVFGAQLKVPSLPFQVSVLAQAGLLVVIERLETWLQTDDLSIRVISDGADPLWPLALKASIDAGVVQYMPISGENELEGIELSSDWIHVAPSPQSVLGLSILPSGHCELLASSAPPLLSSSTPPKLETWQRSLRQFLEHIV